MNTPRLHHEVPAFYLRRFACKHAGNVEVYDIDAARAYTVAPSEALTFRDSYAFTNRDGELDRSVEDLLADIESDAAPLFDRLIEADRLEQSERVALAYYFAATYLRSPFMRRQFAGIEAHLLQVHVQATADHDEAWAAAVAAMNTARDQSEETLKRVRNLFQNPGRLVIELPREASLKAIGSIPDVAERFFEMTWTLGRASGRTLITSDSPMVLGTSDPARNPVANGLRDKNAMLTLPLSPACCWIGHWNPRIPAEVRLSTGNVAAFNRKRAYFAERKLVATPNTHNLAALGRRRPQKLTMHRMAGYGADQQAELRILRRRTD